MCLIKYTQDLNTQHYVGQRAFLITFFLQRSLFGKLLFQPFLPIRRESVMKLAQAHNVSAKTVHATLHKDLALSRIQPGKRSNCFARRQRRRDSECVRWSQGWLPRFLTILDNILTVGGSARGKEQAGRLSLNQGSSQKDLEGVWKRAWRLTLPRSSSSYKNAAKIHRHCHVLQ